MSSTYIVDQKKWASLTIFEQMGNIYSEVGRSFKTIEDVDSQNHLGAVARAVDLFDSTIELLIKSKSPKAKEVLRSKEQFLDIVNDSTANKESIKSLDRYFMQFAIAARLNR